MSEPLAGKRAIVTGANSGIGFYTALGLAKAGAAVVLACRSEAKGRKATAAVNQIVPGAACFAPLDLGDLASVRAFAASQTAPVDLLVNNAGLMALPARQTTKDGFETQIGVNFLGHFALTGALLERLRAAAAARVIQLSSIAHRQGRINLADLQSARRYQPWKAYEQTKLAMLMFALELQRRSDAAGWGLMSLAAHPGIARTEIVANGPGANSPMSFLLKLGQPFVTQSAADGALPVLLAATTATPAPGGYYGPTGFMEFRGPPGIAKISAHALDRAVAAGLWEEAERLTGAFAGT